MTLQIPRFHILFACSLLAAGLACAQTAPSPARPATDQPAEEGPVATFHSDARLVDLHVSVLDKDGKLITNIPESAFQVYENGVPQPIKEFRREDVPVSMGIVIDNSGSMKDKRARVAAASLALVKASNPRDEVFIVDFNDDFYVDQDFTSDIGKLQAALGRIGARGGTAMRDALDLAIDKVSRGHREKKVLLVITDGNDNASNISLDQLTREAQRSEVLIYTIGLLNEEVPRDARSARRALKTLAEASGGTDYYPKDLAEVEAITPQIAHEVRNQYLLAYEPTNPTLDGTYRKIEVKVTGFGHPTIRARNGYFATPEESTHPRTASVIVPSPFPPAK